MNKYLRTPLSEIRRAPAHRFTSYLSFLDFNEPTGENEYINRLVMQRLKYKVNWDDEDETEALEALQWLVDNGLAKVVELENGEDF